MKSFLLKHKFKLIIPACIAAIYLVAIFSLGYKIPQGDIHPDWGEFPNHTNPNIVIEEIKNFDSLYPNFKRPEINALSDQHVRKEHYKTNLKNIKSIGFAITDNELVLGSAFRFNFNPNSSGGGKVFKTRFIQRGIEYFQIAFKHQSASFKFTNILSNDTSMQYFYQYNDLTANDTLYFRFFSVDYKAFIKEDSR